MLRAKSLTVLCAVLILTALNAHADVVLDWNAIMQTTVNTAFPFVQGRSAAIVQLSRILSANKINSREFRPGCPRDASLPLGSPRPLVAWCGPCRVLGDNPLFVHSQPIRRGIADDPHRRSLAASARTSSSAPAMSQPLFRELSVIRARDFAEALASSSQTK